MPNDRRSPIFQAKTAIQNISDRIRRAFGAAGEIPVALTEQLQLVAIAADLLEPGNSPYRGRYFTASIGIQNAAVGSTSWALRNSDPVVIDLVLFSAPGGAGDTHTLFLLDPLTAPLNVPATPAGTWRDQKRNATDRPPLLDNNNLWLADATAYGSAARILSLTGVGLATQLFPVATHMLPGSTLVWQNNIGATKAIGVSVFGKIF